MKTAYERYDAIVRTIRIIRCRGLDEVEDKAGYTAILLNR